MRLLSRGLALLTLVAAVAAGGMFALQNTHRVPLDLLFFQLPEQAVAIWILVALALGVLLGLSAGALLSLRRAATIRSLRKQRDRLMSEAQKVSGNDL